MVVTTHWVVNSPFSLSAWGVGDTVRRVKPEAVLQALVDCRIDLAPVLDPNGIVSWTAAVVKLAPDGWQNFISERDFAQGDTPTEAVVALVAKLRRTKPAAPPEVFPTLKPPAPKPSAPKPAKPKPSKRKR